MKKITLLLAVAGALIACDNDECWQGSIEMDMMGERAELTVNDVEVHPSDVVNSADLRIKLFCEFNSVVMGSYPEDDAPCSFNNHGLRTRLRNISVTCNKTIANIEAGKDLIAVMNPLVYVKGQYELSVPALISSLNEGRFGQYYGGTILTGIPYEFDFAVIPYYVTVAEGDYTFKMTVTFDEYSSPQRPTISFTLPSVHLK